MMKAAKEKKLAHAVREIGCYACVELSMLLDDVKEPVSHGIIPNFWDKVG